MRLTKAERRSLVHMAEHGGLGTTVDENWVMLRLEERGLVRRCAPNDNTFAHWMLTPAGEQEAKRDT